MGIDDKIRNAAQDLTGKVKEGVGKVTDNTSMEVEGKLDQAAAAAKKAGEDIKDGVKRALDSDR